VTLQGQAITPAIRPGGSSGTVGSLRGGTDGIRGTGSSGTAGSLGTAGCVPDRAHRELRALTRTRPTLLDERSAAVKRLQAVRAAAPLKRAGGATALMGGQARLAALRGGESAPAVVAPLARGKLRRQRAALEQAWAGPRSAPHRRVVAVQLEPSAFLHAALAQVSADSTARVRPCAEASVLLESLPGVERRTAAILRAARGGDRGRFASSGHLASGAAMCPTPHASAGQRTKAPARKGTRALRRAVTAAARAAARTKQAGRTRLAGQYRRLVVRCGQKKAAVAVGHTILRLLYQVFPHHKAYQEPDLSSRDERRRAQAQQRALHQLHVLGSELTITPTEPTA
jgi:transposase